MEKINNIVIPDISRFVGSSASRAKKKKKQATTIFPFTELLEELQELVCLRHLDLPSFLAWSHVSKYYRNLLWEKTKMKKSFNNFTFLEECAEQGYLSLLHWAHSSGSTIPWRFVELLHSSDIPSTASHWCFSVFEIAAMHNHDKIVAWLCILFRENKTIVFHHGLLKAAAIHGNRRLLDFILNPKILLGSNITHHQTLARLLCESGHSDIAQELMRANNAAWFSGMPWSVFAAIGGNLTAAIAFAATESNPRHGTALDRLLLGGFQGGHVEIVAYALQRGVIPSEAIFVDTRRLFESEKLDEIMGLLETSFPNFVALNIQKVASAAYLYPSKKAYEWLLRKEGGLSVEDHLCLLNGYKGFAHYDNEDIIRRLNDTKYRRLECIKYLEGLGFQWSGDMISEIAAWTTLSQFKFLVERSTTPSVMREHFIVYYMSRDVLEIDYIKYLIEKIWEDVEHSRIVKEEKEGTSVVETEKQKLERKKLFVQQFLACLDLPYLPSPFFVTSRDYPDTNAFLLEVLFAKNNLELLDLLFVKELFLINGRTKVQLENVLHKFFLTIVKMDSRFTEHRGIHYNSKEKKTRELRYHNYLLVIRFFFDRGILLRLGTLHSEVNSMRNKYFKEGLLAFYPRLPPLKKTELPSYLC